VQVASGPVQLVVQVTSPTACNEGRLWSRTARWAGRLWSRTICCTGHITYGLLYRSPLVPYSLLYSVVASSAWPSSAGEGFGSPAGCVLLTTLQCCCLWPPVLPQPMRVSAVLQDGVCRLLCNVVASVHKSSISQ